MDYLSILIYIWLLCAAGFFVAFLIHLIYDAKR